MQSKYCHAKMMFLVGLAIFWGYIIKDEATELVARVIQTQQALNFLTPIIVIGILVWVGYIVDKR